MHARVVLVRLSSVHVYCSASSCSVMLSTVSLSTNDPVTRTFPDAISATALVAEMAWDTHPRAAIATAVANSNLLMCLFIGRTREVGKKERRKKRTIPSLLID